MKKVLFAGSFDPITCGHLDLINRASLLCETIVVGVVENKSKVPYFTVEERMNMIREATAHLDNVEVDEFGRPVPDHAWADDMIQVPVVIDLKAPTMDLDSLKYYTENGRNYVSFQVEDNYDIAAVVTTTMGGGAYDYIPVNTKIEGVDGETDTIVLDITDYDTNFQLVLCDYGCNETYYELTNVGNEGLAEDEFFGFRRYSTPTIDGSLYATAENGGYELITYAGIDPMNAKVDDATVRVTAYAFAGSDVKMPEAKDKYYLYISCFFGF